MFDIKNINLNWDNFAGSGRAIVTDVKTAYEYKDGQRTDKVVGLKVTVVFPSMRYNDLTVTVADPVDRLSTLLDKGDPLYVEFTGFKARIYTMNGRTGISAKAESVYVVDTDGFADSI